VNDVLARTVDVTRRYGGVLALDRVSVEVRAGEVVGLLGPNGAGKTTLVNLFVGLRRPSGGRVELFGGDPRKASTRGQIGMTPQETGLPATLRVGECIDFVAAHFPHPVDRAELVAQFGLDGLERRQTGSLSGGQKRRLAVALAFAGRPRLVFLDEPTTGLDVEARRGLWQAIRVFHARGGAVLLTSHYLEEIEELAERVIVVGGGRVLADDTVAAVRRLVGVQRVSLTVRELPHLSNVVGVEHDGGRTHLLTTDADRLVRDLVLAGTAFSGLEIRASSLEEAFLTLTSAPAGPVAAEVTAARPS
jgi:ABC-2 type transport system ATP-binding protein